MQSSQPARVRDQRFERIALRPRCVYRKINASTKNKALHKRIPCYTVKQEIFLMQIRKSILFIMALNSLASCTSPKTMRKMAEKKT